MGVIHRKAAHPRQAVQLAALFIAVNRAQFGQAQGQIAVAAQLALVNFDVVRAVHRLEHELLVIHVDGRVLAVFVVGIVAAGYVQVDFADVGRDHRQITTFHLRLTQEALPTLSRKMAPLGSHKGKPEPTSCEMWNNSNCFTQTAMIPRFGFFQQFQIFVQFDSDCARLCRKCAATAGGFRRRANKRRWYAAV